MRTLLAACVTAAALTVAPPAARAQTIDGPPLAPGFPFGRTADPLDPVFQTFGQSFMTPAGAPILQSFTFYLSDFLGGTALQLQAGVAPFDGSQITGPVLYWSGVRNGSGAFPGPEAFTFNTGGLLLSSSVQYLAFLTVSTQPPMEALNLAFVTGAPLPGALYVQQDFGNSMAPTSEPFLPTPADAAFNATFTAAATTVPEPATVLLVGGGLALVGMVGRRRRQAQA